MKIVQKNIVTTPSELERQVCDNSSSLNSEELDKLDENYKRRSVIRFDNPKKINFSKQLTKAATIKIKNEKEKESKEKMLRLIRR